MKLFSLVTSSAVHIPVLVLAVAVFCDSKVATGAYRLADLGPLADLAKRDDSRPYGLNANGEVALTNLAGGAYRAFRVGGSSINLGTLGGEASFAAGNNDSGSVAGHSLNSAGQSHAFLWHAGGVGGPAIACLAWRVALNQRCRRRRSQPPKPDWRTTS